MSMITNRDQIDCLPLKRTRKKVNIGDVFVMNISENFYIFGQVIVTDINSYDKGVNCLVIFYKLKSSKLCLPYEISSLEEVELLTERPFLVHKTCWFSGLFQNVANIKVPNKIKPFYFKSTMKNGVVDVYGNLVQNYPKNKELTGYGITPLGGILNSIRKVYDKSPEWFRVADE